MRSTLQRRLDDLVATYDVEASLRADPLGFVHEYPGPADREVVGLIAATLAFGHVTTVRTSVRRVLSALGRTPARTVDASSERALARSLRGFVHRVYKGPDVARMLAHAGSLRRDHGSLGEAFAARYEARGGDLREALAGLADALRGPRPSAGLRHLVSDPRAGSACKRLLLYLRWMVRPADGVDLGLWPVSPAALVIPLDTHVHRIARNLGLTDRRTPSWRTAEQITARLRAFCPEDPVRYDFAICHLGVSRDCPSRRDPRLCARCTLRTVCGQWRPRQLTSRRRPGAARAP